MRPSCRRCTWTSRLRDHTLLQAICLTNRPYGETKTHGLIVDYLGVFDDVAPQAIQFDEEGHHPRRDEPQ